MLKKIQLNFDLAQTKQKVKDRRWNSKNFMLERLNKQKISVQDYVANYKND